MALFSVDATRLRRVASLDVWRIASRLDVTWRGVARMSFATAKRDEGLGNVSGIACVYLWWSLRHTPCHAGALPARAFFFIVAKPRPAPPRAVTRSDHTFFLLSPPSSRTLDVQGGYGPRRGAHCVATPCAARDSVQQPGLLHGARVRGKLQHHHRSSHRRVLRRGGRHWLHVPCTQKVLKKAAAFVHASTSLLSHPPPVPSRFHYPIHGLLLCDLLERVHGPHGQ